MFKINDIVKFKINDTFYNGIVIDIYPLTIIPLLDYSPFIQLPFNYPLLFQSHNKDYKFKHNCIIKLYSIFQIKDVKNFINEVNFFLNSINPFYQNIEWVNDELVLDVISITGVKCYKCIDIKSSKNVITVPEHLLLKYGTLVKTEYVFKNRKSYFKEKDKIEFYINEDYKTTGIIYNISYFNEFTNEYFYNVITDLLPIIDITISESDIIKRIDKDVNTRLKKVHHKFINGKKLFIEINEYFINKYLKETHNNFNKGKQEFLYELTAYNIPFNKKIELTLNQHSDFDNFYYDSEFCNKLLFPENALAVFK